MTEIEIEVVTYACQEHKQTVFDAVKWHLVNKGLWYPEELELLRKAPDPFGYLVKNCFCGKPATHIVKYKIPLKVKT